MFDLSNVTTNSPLKDDKYVCNVTNAIVKDTQSGTGKYIKVEMTISEGDSKGRKIFTNFNIENPNPKAVEIGLQQLKSMLESSNYNDPNKLTSIDSLNGITLGVKTRTKDDRSEVHYFFKPKTVSPQGSNDSIPF